MVIFPRLARVAGFGLAVALTSVGFMAAGSPRSVEPRAATAPAPSFTPFVTDVHTVVLAAGDRVRSVCDASNMPAAGYLEFDWAPLDEPAPAIYCSP